MKVIRVFTPLIIVFLLIGCQRQNLTLEFNEITGYSFDEGIGDSEDAVLDFLKKNNMKFVPAAGGAFQKGDKLVTTYEIEEEKTDISYSVLLSFVQLKDGKQLISYEKTGRKEKALSVTEAAEFRRLYDRFVEDYGEPVSSSFTSDVFAKYPNSDRVLIRNAYWEDQKKGMQASLSLQFVNGKTTIYFKESAI